MRITSVEPQKKTLRRVRQAHRKQAQGKFPRFNIFLDGKFAFGADEDLIVEKRLVLGKEIDPEAIKDLIFEAEAGKLIVRVYSLLNIRLRSEKEIRDYLKNLSFKRKLEGKEEISLLTIDLIVKKLTQKGLINDLEFATRWVESKVRKQGMRVIKTQLLKKGISKDIVDQACLERSREVSSEKDVAKNLLNKRLSRWESLSPFDLKKKATEFLLRRGFDYGLVKSLVDNLVKLRYDNSEEI